ncbi:MAG: tRNA uridine-5-carboxymethylaminomethyl(34) synthesis enzyme MnmG [Alphaproteobacteria bacterium]|nr:tRNA uridine-5-carboxymethylaminomethyl(34) synthesis enzyme MnmG [Rickettsiales bacterium]
MEYDVIVIGGGHAGVEAACAAVRMGCNVALVTMSKNDIGAMSCNPSVGGIGKGTLVREVDALGGLMGRVTDISATSFKILNSSKGPAVWGWRAQIDREKYKENLNKLLSVEYSKLNIIYNEVKGIMYEKKNCASGALNKVVGVTLINNKILLCKVCIVAVGTFLGAEMNVGFDVLIGGRAGSNSSFPLLDSLRSLGFELKKFKTGTPPRLRRDSIDTSKLAVQQHDKKQKFFSILTDKSIEQQEPCYVLKTNLDSHQILLDNVDKSPIFSKEINIPGPRYCPSIEDKVTRFLDKDSHTFFLEPEGFNSDLFYPSGLATSMPPDVQLNFFRAINGLEKVKIQNFGYVVQYYYINPIIVRHTLETKLVDGLFFSGQINGTTGYEEAAGQGIIAGINAALQVFNKSELTLSRFDSFIGVMIDDIVSLGVGNSPYRVFTSRAENRLSIRGDNAHYRLTPLGLQVGCLGKNLESTFEKLKKDAKIAKEVLLDNFISAKFVSKVGLSSDSVGKGKSAYKLLSMGCDIDDIFQINPSLEESLKELNEDSVFTVTTDAFYSPHIDRQRVDIANLQKANSCKLRTDFDYSVIGSLSAEVIEKLNKHKPETLADAIKIPGITSAAAVAIMYYFSNN